jgi:hypothetical protein
MQFLRLWPWHSQRHLHSLHLRFFVTEALALAKVPAFLVLLVTRPLATSSVTSDFTSLVLATSVASDFAAFVTIAGCMNSMKWMDDGNGSRWIGHMNSIAARVASCHELPVMRERTTNEGARGWNKSCDRWPGDVANAYAVITKKPENYSHYRRIPWNVTTKNATVITSTIMQHGKGSTCAIKLQV